jgi:anti-sigma regulatory factor (Ser/Thr protein kinase)
MNLARSTTPHPPPARPPLVDSTVPADAGQVGALRRAAVRLAVLAGLSPDRCADVSLAVGEACANAVVHAYVGQERGTLSLRGTIGERGLELRVTDAGKGLRARDDSPGLGLGLPLIATLASEIEIRTPARGGTEIWMLFGLAPPASWAATG